MTKPILFPLLAVALFSCRPKGPAPTVTPSNDHQKAELLYRQHNDSAFYYFNKAAAGAKDSLQKAIDYHRMARIQEDAGDYFGSQESLSLSLKCLDTNNSKQDTCLAADYNELGLNSLDLKDPASAIGFFERAIHFAPNKAYGLVYRNNKALAYEKKGAYPQALKIYRATLAQTTDTETVARLLTNIATTQWLYQPAYPAAPLLLKALHLRERIKDQWGLNSSYAHLADYYLVSHPDSALRYANEMYKIACSLNSPDDQLEALQKLIRLSDPATSRRSFLVFARLNDSLQGARNAARNQFALIRYDTEKAKADNLRLQKDNTEERYQLLQKNILLYSSLGIFTALAVVGWLWYRKREQRIALAFSQKVHDEVANGLYKMIKQVEGREKVDLKDLLTEITRLYNRSRNISYNAPEQDASGFDEKISALLTGFGNTELKIAVAGNSAELWDQVSRSVKAELELILLELMVNMRKHSRATLAVVKFKRTSGRLEIVYTDNGVGFPAELKKGNGLINTENRMNGIKGSVTFGMSVPKGARIQLSVPLIQR